MEWEDLSKLIQLFKEHSLGELEYEDERFKLKIKVPQQAVVASMPMQSLAAHAKPEAGPGPVKVEVEAERGKVVTSPFVGTFYRQPSPDSAPYVEVGQIVSRGQVLCIIEAMKLMNEIEAESSGRIAKIFVENGRPVEFGEQLLLIEPL